MTNRMKKAIAIVIVVSIGLFAIEMYQESTNVSLQDKHERIMKARQAQ